MFKSVENDDALLFSCKASLTNSPPPSASFLDNRSSKMYGSSAGTLGGHVTNNNFNIFDGHHQRSHLVVEWFKEGEGLVPTTSSQGDPHAHRQNHFIHFLQGADPHLTLDWTFKSCQIFRRIPNCCLLFIYLASTGTMPQQVFY